MCQGEKGSGLGVWGGTEPQETACGAGRGAWSPGDPVPDRHQAGVQGLGATVREKGPEGKAGSGT